MGLEVAPICRDYEKQRSHLEYQGLELLVLFRADLKGGKL